MRFSIVMTKFKYIYSVLAYLCFICLFIVPLHFQYRNSIGLLLLLLIIFFEVLGYKSWKVFIKGEIRFEDGFVIVYDDNNKIINKLSLESVDEIKLKYLSFKGGYSLYGGIVSNFIPSKGGNNKIKIKLKDKLFKYNIYLESETDAIRLKMLYSFLKENNINVHLKGF